MKKLFSILIFVTINYLLFINNCSAQIISTVAGNGTAGYTGDGGQATNAELHSPIAITIDISGNLYIVDEANNCVRKINASGVITTIAGNGTNGFSGDGGQATLAALSNPTGIAIDLAGNLYIADYSNNRIRKVSTSGIITTVAGNGTYGFSGDGGQATNAQLYWPQGVAIDNNGNIYIADYNNSRIRQVNTSGIITTIAGNGTVGYTGDGGQATSAELTNPTDVVLDASGNIYFTDFNNYAVRKINTSGIITTIAGNGTFGFSGDGGPATAAELFWPQGLTVDATGNIYIADEANFRIRKVNTSGIITTIAGNGTYPPGFSGDGGQAIAAELNDPSAVVLDNSGNLYIADYNNNRIRMVTNVAVGVNQLLENNLLLSVYPNPAANNLCVEVKNKQTVNISICDVLGKEILNTIEKDINVSDLQNGIYFVSVKTGEGVLTKKIVVQH